MKFSTVAFSMLLLFFGLSPSLLAQARIDRPPFFEDGQEFLDREIQRLEQQQNASPDEQKPNPLTIEEDREERARETDTETRGRGDAGTHRGESRKSLQECKRAWCLVPGAFPSAFFLKNS